MKFVKDILKGVVIGVANAIPGVSGGTMMVSMGVYDDIIYCITHLFKQLKKSIMILLPYFIGMVIGIIGLAFSIKSLYANFPFQTSMVFIGLILGGVPMIWEKVCYSGSSDETSDGSESKKAERKKNNIGAGHVIIFALFFAAIILMQYFGSNGNDVTLTVGLVPALKIFVIGIIASATMVIPGVSGSMMLMILGYYNPIINAITEFITALSHGDISKVLTICGSLIPFGIGVVIGIFAIAKLIEILLDKFEDYTYCAILGLVVSSPIVILMGTALTGVTVATIITGIVALIAGVIGALQLGK